MRFKTLSLGVAALVGLVLTKPALAAEWQFVTEGTDIFVNIDTTSIHDRPAVPIRRPFPVRQAWVKFTFHKTADRWDKEEMRLTSVNCEDETSLVLSSTDYFPHDVVGDTARVEDYDFYYQPSPPDTVGAAVIKFICNL